MTIPHGRKLAADYAEFVADLDVSLRSFLGAAQADADLRSIFKSSTAAFTVFTAFSRRQDRLLLAASAGLARRIAVLSVIRQVSLARVELRRLIECAFWYVYFADHPVEQQEFYENPSRGWEGREGKPIATAASAPLSFYAQYAKERLEKDPSRLGVTACGELYQSYGALSAEVHAAMGAVHPSGSLALAFDQYDGAVIARLREECSRVFRNALLVATATTPLLLSALDAIDRSWFDWLVGEDARVIRGAPFGVGA